MRTTCHRLTVIFLTLVIPQFAHAWQKSPPESHKNPSADSSSLRVNQVERKTAIAQRIQDYLTASYECSIHQVKVTGIEVVVQGQAPWSNKQIGIREALLNQSSIQDSSSGFSVIKTDSDGAFTFHCARIEDSRDRLTSRWQVVSKDKGLPLSPCVWSTSQVAPKDALKPTPELHLAKGLGGVSSRFGLDELLTLGVRHITVNVIITDLLKEKADSPQEQSRASDVSQWNLEIDRLQEVDRIVRFATKHNIVVAAILLIPQRSNDSIVHPESTSAAPYSMPNLTTEASAQRYSSIIRLLAERYSTADMRIDHWIAHNEVDFAWQWTNMGEQPLEIMLDHYYRSMRIIDLETGRHNPHAKVFVSLTHHFNNPHANWRNYSGRKILETLARASQLEGDFNWGIAYHPYPPSLFHPMRWPANAVTQSLDTEKVTMKNLGVLGKFLEQPTMRGLDGKMRTVLLSEQGYHAPASISKEGIDQSAENLQAEALLYAWERMRETNFVTAFDYHRWVDHPVEGGLRLGLRGLPTKDLPAGMPKIGWQVYRDLATPAEQKWRERFED